MSVDNQKRIAELKQEIAKLEVEEDSSRRARLGALYKDMSREDMKLLREMLNNRIAETYDGDDE